ncbi:chitobiase/beta-hexosaminidase C-terminal domain-containing protein [Pendulispora rubella]|uniref:Chitobiase/beta-hexosaminidase C-terminal domain-containing protein n=1 Tax=Pendulispora rubella TaxID=2741070 RepID=A0ABZ2L5N4_9BACT
MVAVVAIVGCGGDPETFLDVDAGFPWPQDGGVKEPVATPEFDPGPGTFTSAVSISIQTATPQAVIHYTVDGSTPTAASTAYGSPISIAKTTTVKAIAVRPGYPNSEVQTGVYTIDIASGTVAAVSISPSAGTYENDVGVTLTSATARATICYTLDKSAPACLSDMCARGSTYYDARRPVSITQSGQRITAIACDTRKSPSPLTQADYSLKAAAPVFDPAPKDFDEYEWSTVALRTNTAGGVIHYTVDGSTPTCASPNIFNERGTIPAGAFADGVAIRALTCKEHYSASDVAVAAYYIRPTYPTFDPPAGTPIPATQEALDVTLSSIRATEVAYATDGSTPSCSGLRVANGGKVRVTANSFLTALGCRTGHPAGGSSQAHYPKAGTTAAPDFSPAGGTYGFHQDVAASSWNADRVCYTVNGADPDCNESACTTGSPFPEKLAVNTTGTVIKAIACKSGLFKSSVASAVYHFKVDDVFFGLFSGWDYPVGSDLQYSSGYTGSEGGVTYHAAYGTDPTCASDPAPGWLQPDERVDLRVIGCKEGYEPSKVRVAEAYRPITAMPTFSPGSGNYTDTPTVTLDSVTRSRAGWPTKICYTMDDTEPGCDAATLACTGTGDVHGGAAPLAVKVKTRTSIRATACATSGKLPAWGWAGESYWLEMSEMTFSPAPSSGPFTGVIPKIDIAIATPPENPRICWSDTRSVVPEDCLAETAPAGVRCANAASVSADHDGLGYDSDTTLNAVACKRGEPGLIPSTGQASYTVVPYAHVIEMDGVNDFATVDALTTKSGNTAFVSWDRHGYIYVGMQGAPIGSTTDYVSVYLSGDGGVRTGLDTGVVSSPTALPFAAKYHVRWKTDGRDTRVRLFNGIAWVDAPFQLTDGEIARGGTGASSFVEFRLPRSAFGDVVDIAGTLWKDGTIDAWPALDGHYVHANFASARPAGDSIFPRP